MSDDVRRVNVIPNGDAYSWVSAWDAVNNGSHALLPWSEYDRLRAKVERLSLERQTSDHIVGRLRAEVKLQYGRLIEKSNIIRDLNARLAEKGHHITDEQIDAAWSALLNRVAAYGWYEEWVAYAVAILRLAGIIECPECGGRGDHSVDGPLGVDYIDDCGSCQGHGWIREERGDE